MAQKIKYFLRIHKWSAEKEAFVTEDRTEDLFDLSTKPGKVAFLKAAGAALLERDAKGYRPRVQVLTYVDDDVKLDDSLFK